MKFQCFMTHFYTSIRCCSETHKREGVKLYISASSLHNQFKNFDKTMIMEELKWFRAALHHSLFSHRYKVVCLCPMGAFECNFMQGFSLTMCKVTKHYWGGGTYKRGQRPYGGPNFDRLYHKLKVLLLLLTLLH